MALLPSPPEAAGPAADPAHGGVGGDLADEREAGSKRLTEAEAYLTNGSSRRWGTPAALQLLTTSICILTFLLPQWGHFPSVVPGKWHLFWFLANKVNE